MEKEQVNENLGELLEDANTSENSLTDEEVEEYKDCMRGLITDTYINLHDLKSENFLADIPEDKLKEILDQFLNAIAEEAVKYPDMQFVKEFIRYEDDTKDNIDDEYTGWK